MGAHAALKVQGVLPVSAPVRDAFRGARDRGKAISHCEMRIQKEDNPARWDCQGESVEFAHFSGVGTISHSEISEDHLDILCAVGYNLSSRFHYMKHLSLRPPDGKTRQGSRKNVQSD